VGSVTDEFGIRLTRFLLEAYRSRVRRIELQTFGLFRSYGWFVALQGLDPNARDLAIETRGARFVDERFLYRRDFDVRVRTGFCGVPHIGN
jgi:hypothetical protein